MNGVRFGHRVSLCRIARRGLACLLALPLLLTALVRASAQNPDNNPTNPATAPEDNPLHTASRTELDVAKVILAQEKAWNAGDLDAYLKAYKDSPETIFVGKQISRGYAQIVDDYKHNYLTRASMGTLAYAELEVHPLGDGFAVCLGKYHLDRTRKEGGPVDGMFSLVMEKTADGWKIVLDHTT